MLLGVAVACLCNAYAPERAQARGDSRVVLAEAAFRLLEGLLDLVSRLVVAGLGKQLLSFLVVALPVRCLVVSPVFRRDCEGNPHGEDDEPGAGLPPLRALSVRTWKGRGTAIGPCPVLLLQGHLVSVSCEASLAAYLPGFLGSSGSSSQ